MAKTQETQPEIKEVEPVYSMEDFISNASALGVKPEAIVGALTMAGVKEATRSQMERYLRDFLRKEV